jgi:hypothetical protein
VVETHQLGFSFFDEVSDVVDAKLEVDGLHQEIS